MSINIKKAEKKGKYRRMFESNYVVLDLETTGLSTKYDEIIEVGAIKVRDNEIVDKFNYLIKPINILDDDIIELTGITNEMLIDCPRFEEIYDELIDFIGDDIILGHNTSFDLNFIISESKKDLHNDYMDTLHLSRIVIKELPSYRLQYLSSHFNINRGSHRSIEDCITTKELYDILKYKAVEFNIDINKKRKSHSKTLDANSITITEDLIDENSVLYERNCVFTGTLSKMIRRDAMQSVINIGGFVQNSVNKHTNFLILGDLDYCKSIKDGKSIKHKKALVLQNKGQDIEVIDEFTFYNLLGNNTF